MTTLDYIIAGTLIFALILIVLFVIVCFAGYFMNIIALAGMSFPITTEMILRSVGIIVWPIGIVMGLFV
jgi:hypothetical protein